MNIQLPEINLNGILPIAGLALIAVLCIIALLVRILLHSRVALLIAVILGVVAAGPTLAFSLEQIVGELVPCVIVFIIGGVTLVYLMHRNPELLSMVRDMVPRRSTTIAPTVIDQLPAPKLTAPRTTVKRTVQRGGMDDWGLR
jgi:predicted permease